MSGSTSPVLVDARGKACPVPVIELARAVAQVAVGDEVTVLSDDPGSKVDIPVWCRMRNHELVGMEQRDGAWWFEVRRSA